MIISKAALAFNAPDGFNAKIIQVAPRSRPQEVPDAVANTETFRAALKAGLIVILGLAAPVIEAPAVESKPVFLNYQSGIPPQFR